MTVSGPDSAAPTGVYPAGPSAEEMAEQEAILAAEIAAGIFESPPEDEFSALLADPDCGPPEGADAWLGELASPVREAILDAQAAAETDGRPVTEPFPVAFLVHDGRGPGGAGFGSGSVLDGLEPGPVLAAALDDAWQAGLNRLPDDELAGLVLAWRRCESRAAAGLLAAVSELSRRREAAGDRQVIEHVDDEIAALLTLTRRSADLLLGLADSLHRLPVTMSALQAGRIDRARADVIAYETAMLDAALAAAVEQLIIEDAPSLTTSGLRARVRRAVLAADPDAARRRAEKAVRDARVELFDERAGTAGLAGRDLPVPAALAADQRIDAWARRLKADGLAATLTQLRAAVFLGLLSGNDPITFLLPPESDQEGAAPDGRSAPDAAPQRQDGPARPDGRARQDGQARGPAAPGPAVLRGSVHLTMPLTAWLGMTQSPGEVAGFGPVTRQSSRDLADRIAANLVPDPDRRGWARRQARLRPPATARRNRWRPDRGLARPPEDRPGGIRRLQSRPGGARLPDSRVTASHREDEAANLLGPRLLSPRRALR